MTKLLRNLGFFLIVAVITLAIFLLVNENQKMKQDVLEYSLDLLGGKLLAMVPDGAGKAVVKEQYDKFVAQTKNKELPPEEVEQVAANILNVTNAESTITAETALSCLTTAMESEDLSEEILAEDTHEARASGKIEPYPIRHKSKRFNKYRDWTTLGNRLSDMYVFNENMRDIIRHNVELKRNLHKNLRYQVESGIKVALDPQLKHILSNIHSPQLNAELKRLENEDLLVWREGMQKLRENMLQLEEEMRYLKELKRLEALQELQHLSDLGQLAQLGQLGQLSSLSALSALSALDTLNSYPGVNADSIRKIVEESLRAAGIPPSEDE